MSEIKQALGRLNEALDNMESAARHTQGKVQKLKQKAAMPAAGQRDLFSIASGAANGTTGGTTGEVSYLHVDPAMLARKLDIAIEKVEQVLREG